MKEEENKKITLLLERSVYEKLKKEHAKKGITLTELITCILYESFFGC